MPTTEFFELFDAAIVEAYLRQCRVKNRLVESDETHVPPTPEETKELIHYLRGLGLQPAIVGSVGILRHLGNDIDPRRDFRPTFDLDVWINKPQVPAPPRGWRKDTASIGVVSWISPSGGYVDFMLPSHEFPSGAKNPAAIEYDEPSLKTDYPIAHWKVLFKMKLNTMRDKDVADALALCRRLGHVPTVAELGKLNQTQRENLELITTWFKLRPKGKYGE